MHPQLLAGDFNTFFKEDETNSSGSYVSQRCKNFRDWMNALSLPDLGIYGSKFTWWWGLSSSCGCAMRLDRALYSVEWHLAFPIADVLHLT